MTLPFDSDLRPKPYITESYPIDETRFIEIEFYEDGEQHRVWPYIGHASEDARFILRGRKHFHVVGAFESHWQAREAAISSAQKYLAQENWDQYV